MRIYAIENEKDCYAETDSSMKTEPKEGKRKHYKGNPNGEADASNSRISTNRTGKDSSPSQDADSAKHENSENGQQNTKRTGFFAKAKALFSATINSEKISKACTWISDILPGGDYRKISRRLDEFSDSFEELLEKREAEQGSFKKRLKLLFKPQKNDNQSNQLKKQLIQLKLSVRWMTGWGFIFGFFGSMLLSTIIFSSFTAKFLSFLLEDSYQEETEIKSGDVVIAIADENNMAYSGHYASEDLAPDSLHGLMAAMQFAAEKKLPLLISGDEKSMQAMRQTAISLGMNTKNIHAAKPAEHLAMKAKYANEACASYGYSKPVIMTSAYKMPRTLCEFRRNGFKEIYAFPVSKSRADLSDAIEYNPPMVKAAAKEYVKYIWSGCAFRKNNKENKDTQK